jgi:pyrroloquinoline-quinone synthase
MSEPMTASGLVGELLAIARESSYRDPMFDAVRTGSISREGVRFWSLQASLVVYEFTRFISAIHANCPHRDGQQLLAENLWEEHGAGVPERDHYSLIRKLARSLGATDQEIDDVRALPETAAYIDHCLRVTRELSFVESMVAIAIGIEIFMPTFFGKLADSLCSHYGLARGDVDYLLVHVTEDEKHSRRALELINAYADTEEIREKARTALQQMLVVKRRFADAVYNHCSTAA